MKIIKITFTLDGQDNIWNGAYISKNRFEIEDIDGIFSITSVRKYLKSENAKNIIITN